MRHRLFTAVSFPAELESKILQLKEQIPYSLNWYKQNRLHLTLNFLGNIPDEQLPNLQSNLNSAIRNLTSFKLHFGFVQTMYRRHEGSYLCLTPDQKSEELIQLQASLKDSVYHLGVPVADRYWPHITVAYFPKSDPVTTKALLDKIDILNLKVRFTFPVDSVVLYESTNDRTGTHYSKVITFPLST